MEEGGFGEEILRREVAHRGLLARNFGEEGFCGKRILGIGDSGEKGSLGEGESGKRSFGRSRDSENRGFCGEGISWEGELGKRKSGKGEDSEDRGFWGEGIYG